MIPALLDIHPLSTPIVPAGTNYVMSRECIKLHYELESLASTLESLGKRCVLSGPIPTMTKSSERFSRLFNLHLMLNVTTAPGLSFISHFDSFWTEKDLFKYDGRHLNRKVTGILIGNFINFIYFSLNLWFPLQDPAQHSGCEPHS